MNFQRIVLIFTCFYSLSSWSQSDCVLGVGITDNDIIAQVFQMNEMQQENLANFSAELKYRNEVLNNQLENIYTRHPQSTVEEINELAVKYRGVMDSMKIVQAMIDKKVLSLFNQKQYEFYLTLCQEAARSPYIITPKVYADSLRPKQR
ncbi:hypothetical protein PP182_16720 [Maribacter sp. PR1]|uniref:Uncharacterized protein n=1 Tax=Maribacter cobaltidurans TaxID=1178778 RepID=A0ABU7IY53_9FLAO|nr:MULTISPECIES: hypothetical protein [Maribacter]MDC6390336.1 hypothetical protein [Maribacter sp. PR1]MEE1977726.1 hypothetical protein [Maribacter cobaltidurans]